MATAINKLARNDAICQNSAVMVDIFQKQIQGGDALGEPVLDPAPLLIRNDPRQKIVGKDTLGALFISVYGKRNPLMQKREVRGLLTLAQLVGGQLQQALEQRTVVITRRPRRSEHLIIGRIKLVIAKRWPE